MTPAECRLEFTYSSEDEAEKILKAVELENPPYIKAWREGPTIVSEASSESLESLLHTLEDYLACITVAEKMLRG